MDDALLVEIATAGQYLVHDLQRVVLCEFLLLLDVLMQIAMRAVLHDDVKEVRGLDDFVQSHYILVHQTSMDLDFCLQHLQVGASELFELNDLDGVPLVYFLYFYSLVDLAGEALAEIIIS